MDNSSPRYFDDDDVDDVGDGANVDTDDSDDLAALGFSYQDAPDDESEFGAGYAADDPEDTEVPDVPAVPELDEAELLGPISTVTNPPGTVTVSAYADGRVRDVELSPKVTEMTEAMLAEEIVVIARLATQDARAAQYSNMLAGMDEHGHDNVATRDFLERELHLPSPQQAAEARAELFARRYASDHE